MISVNVHVDVDAVMIGGAGGAGGKTSMMIIIVRVESHVRPIPRGSSWVHDKVSLLRQ